MPSVPRPSFDRAPAYWPWRVARYALVVVAALLLAYCSLRASPYLSEIRWIPHWLSRWADHHGVLRNTVAFLPFGLIVFGGIGLGWRPVLASAGFAAGIEIPQIWLPHRTFDLHDIAASWAGLALGWLAILMWTGVRRVLPAPFSPP